jgi:hypothetical protein
MPALREKWGLTSGSAGCYPDVLGNVTHRDSVRRAALDAGTTLLPEVGQVKAQRRMHGLTLLAVCGLLSLSMGCSSALRYAQYRGEDALEMIDLGLSITTTPQVGLYWNSLDILVAGYAKLDGYFLGWGGNQLGWTRMHAHCWGLGYGYQEIGWGDYDLSDPDTLYIDNGGIPGFFMSPMPGVPGNIPAYTPACVHFIPHIAYVGIVWNARWWEIIDFVAGFSTLDLSGDDGVEIGSWPWRSTPQWVGD